MSDDTKVPKGRLTVVGHVYHQQGDEQPTACSLAYARPLASQEQPYGPRRVSLSDEWVPLDLGWLAGHTIALLVLHHAEPPRPVKQPTPEEAKARASALVEVGILSPEVDRSKRTMFSDPLLESQPTPILLLGVGESTSIRPCGADRWVVRSVGGGRLSVTAFAE